jgi:hypothetical protein
MGCHSGLNVSNAVSGESGLSDFAQAVATGGGAYVTTTAYGYGDQSSVGLHERLMVLFAGQLDGAVSLGQALAFAKQQYFATQGLYGPYDEKALVTTTLYGLPMYSVGDAGTTRSAASDLAAPQSVAPGLSAANFSVTPTFGPQSSDDGNWFEADGEAPLVVPGRPVQPRVDLDVTASFGPALAPAHGAVVTHLEESATHEDFDAAWSRATLDNSAAEPETERSNLGYPARNATVTTFSDPNGLQGANGTRQRQRVVVVPSRFLSNADGSGTQYLYGQVDGTVYYSGSSDYIAPALHAVDGVVDVQADTVSFSADITDPAGVARAFALVDDGTGWRRVELTGPTAGGTWTATTPVGAAVTDVEWIMQAVDRAGNVGVANDKGRNLVAPPEPVQISVSDAGSATEGGGPLAFTVSLSAASADDVTVEVATLDGTATGASDYQGVTSTLTFEPGETEQPVEVTVLDDDKDEPNETLSLRLFDPTGGVVIDGTGNGSVLDNDEVSHSLSGFVRDSSGTPVRGAVVTLQGSSVPPATTGSDGIYAFVGIPSQSYNVRVAAACLSAQTRNVAVNGPTSSDFTLGNNVVCERRPHAWDSASNVVPLTGDNASAAVTLPFAFRYQNVDYTTAHISTNGALNFQGPNSVAANTALPNSAAPNAAIYPFWDDLVVDGAASVLTGEFGTGAERRFVIEWRNVALAADLTRRFSFEVLLYADRNRRIVFQYRDIASGTGEAGTSATVGREDASGGSAQQVSFNEGVLFDGLSVAPK